METPKKLYPVRFIPIPEIKPWGGDRLIKKLGKEFTVSDDKGNEKRLTASDNIGESLEIADLGYADSAIENGWLAGNTISEIMDTYIERISGEEVYKYYGRQFPVMVKYLDIQGKTSVQVHPDDETAGQRYDALGKSEFWYIMEADPQATIYLGFSRDITAQELYDRCLDGSITEVMNVIHPKKGDSLLIRPGTVHAAEGGILAAEIQESSDLTFRLYDWGRENDPVSARTMHLEEAFDLIDLKKCDLSCYRKAEDSTQGEVSARLVTSQEFTVTRFHVKDTLHIHSGHFPSFMIYMCTEGAVSFQIPSVDSRGEKAMDRYPMKKGETVLIPADMPDFFIVPEDMDAELLETMMEKQEEKDSYINPDTEPFLEGEDYGGLEDGLEESGNDSTEE